MVTGASMARLAEAMREPLRAVTPQITMAGPELVAQLTDLVNRVYADGEKGLWGPGAARTDQAETAALIERGEIAVARIGGRLVGAVRIRVLDDERGELGMLVAVPEQQGTGIGRELVRFAEQWGREQGLTTMQLELLMPLEWEHPVKEFLRAWYTRIGYRQVSLGDLAERLPASPRSWSPPAPSSSSTKPSDPHRFRGTAPAPARRARGPWPRLRWHALLPATALPSSVPSLAPEFPPRRPRPAVARAQVQGRWGIPQIICPASLKSGLQLAGIPQLQ